MLAVHARPPALRHHLDHGRCCSELLHGASLLYNLLLADKAAAHRDRAADTDPDDLREQYRQRLDRWRQMVAGDLDRYAEWSLPEFWELVREVNPRASPRAMRFTERWVHQALERHGDVADDAEARRLVEEREAAVKGRLARTRNLRALERWSGASGVDQLSFRWRQARGFALDVLDGLAG